MRPVPGARVVRKDRFDVWQSREFLDVLAGWDIDCPGFAHPSVESAAELLSGWQARGVG